MLRRAALAALVITIAPAAVAHADRGELTEQSPYTLKPGEIRLGLSDTSIGLFGHELLRRFEVGTRPIAWLPSVAGLPSYDIHAKFELWRDDHLSLAVAAEHLAVDLSSLVTGDADDMTADVAFAITPIEGWAGLRLGKRVRINAGAVYTRVALRGATTVGPIDELGGAIGTSNFQLRANTTLRLTRTLHLSLGGRFVPWQRQWAEATVAGGNDDGEVENTTRGESDLMDVGGRAWSVGGELHLTWEHTNIRLGVEYGNYSVPIVNFVTAQRGWLPVIDLYWRL